MIENKKDFSKKTALVFRDYLNKKTDKILVTKKEREKLKTGYERLMRRAELMCNYYVSELVIRLCIVEFCFNLESHSMSTKFLNEIEDGNYNNRKISKTVNLFLNYFKNVSVGKKPAETIRANEFYLIYQMMNDLKDLENIYRGSFSVEKKQIYKDKMLSETKYLNTFVNDNDLIYETIFHKLELLMARREYRVWENMIKEQDRNLQERGLWVLEDIIFQLFNNLLNMKKININSGEEENKIQENKKKKGPKKTLSFVEINKYLNSIPNVTQDNLNLSIDKFWELFDLTNDVLTAEDQVARKPKLPKGTKDYHPLQMRIKNEAIKRIKNIFVKHGAVQIDTPIFEKKETLLGKYGEEGGKLIYDLEDQGGELLSLRYDLTVPFARYMGLHNLQKIKRFHIAKVYRRDQPNIKKGRFREFYQCDFDIAGKYDKMIPDSEIVTIMAEILESFELNFEIKISHRKLLEAMIECSDIPLSKFKEVCSSVDKLDKETWEVVSQELKEQKGLNSEQAEKLHKFVVLRGPINEIVEKIEEANLFGDNKKAAESLSEIKLFSKYLEILGKSNYVVFDLSLARGLDYYTGIIYEAVLVDGKSNLGSIGGGGRYDGLIGSFSNKQIPAVGMSIGIERLFVILEEKMKDTVKPSETNVLVATIGQGLIEEKLKTVASFWAKNVNAEVLYFEKGKVDRALKYALENQIKFIVWIGEEEAKSGNFKIKDTESKTEEIVKREELVDYVLKKLA